LEIVIKSKVQKIQKQLPFNKDKVDDSTTIHVQKKAELITDKVNEDARTVHFPYEDTNKRATRYVSVKAPQQLTFTRDPNQARRQ